MADDIITLGGGSGREPPRAAGAETAESLFGELYPRLVTAACTLVGDKDVAAELAQEAFLRLWRRSGRETALRGLPGVGPGRTADRQAAWLYLQGEMLRAMRRPMTRRAIRRRAAERRERGRPVAAPAAGEPGGGEPGVDTRLARAEFEALRVRARRNRKITAAVAVAVVIAVAGYPVLAGRTTEHRPPGRPEGGQGSVASTVPGPGSQPPAGLARIPVSGVVGLAADAAGIWAVRAAGPPVPGQTQNFQLVRINPHTDKVTLRVDLGTAPRSVAAGAGLVWLTTPSGTAGGRLVALDPATGRAVRRVNLPAGDCTYVGFTAGNLVAACHVTSTGATDFVRVDPATGDVVWQEGTDPGAGLIGQVAVAPQSVWYQSDYVRIGAFVDTAGSIRAVTIDDPGYRGGGATTQSIVYGDTWVWALSYNESVARIDPLTGVVNRIYTRRSYDPQGYGGLDHMTAGAGSLWFLDDGYPEAGVLRVSEATGRPTGFYPLTASSCNQQPCSQIYFAAGSVWVPTATQVFRIDPAGRSPAKAPGLPLDPAPW